MTRRKRNSTPGRCVSPVDVGAFFGITITDLRRDGTTILLASGAGLMMAVADAGADVRWCVDLDTIRHAKHRIPELIVALDRNTHAERIALAGWFSIDDPAPMLEGLTRVRRAAVERYIGGTDDLESFLKAIKNPPRSLATGHGEIRVQAAE